MKLSMHPAQEEQAALAQREELTSFAGLDVRLAHDRLDRRCLDNVLPILDEEQVATWRLLGDEMVAAAAADSGTGAGKAELSLLDVGTGSGFWAILVAAALARGRRGGRLLAIDKCRRAVEVAGANAVDNGVDVEVRRQEYGPLTVAPESVAAVFMNPPYHLYPPEVEAAVPYHARGGPHGYELFRSWLELADRHLAPDGKLFFHHMCLGNEQPLLAQHLAEWMHGEPSLHYFNLLPPADTRHFLAGVYGERHPEFVADVAARFRRLFFISGVIVRDGRGGRRSEATAVATARGATWQRRIALHRAIASFGSGEIRAAEEMQA